MYDAKAPSSVRVLAEIAKPTVWSRLHELAHSSTRKAVDAEDLVHDVLIRVCDPDDVPWDPKERPFLTHMRLVMKQTWDRTIRPAHVKSEVFLGDLSHDERRSSADPSPHERHEDSEQVAIYKAVLEEALREIEGKYPLARQMFDLVAEGTREPAEQARILECEVGEIYRMRDTVKYHARRMLERREVAEERRMRELQQATRKSGERP